MQRKVEVWDRGEQGVTGRVGGSGGHLRSRRFQSLAQIHALCGENGNSAPSLVESAAGHFSLPATDSCCTEKSLFYSCRAASSYSGVCGTAVMQKASNTSLKSLLYVCFLLLPPLSVWASAGRSRNNLHRFLKNLW